MDGSFKYSEDGEDEEVSGILRANYGSNAAANVTPTATGGGSAGGGGEYYDVLSRFGDLMTGSSASLDSTGSFTSFVQSAGPLQVSQQQSQSVDNVTLGQATERTWSHNSPATAMHGPSPTNAFKFGLSGLSIPTLGSSPGYAAPTADERAAWYENLPQGEQQEKQGASPELSPGVPLDLEFLSSNGEPSPQPSYGFQQSSSMQLNSATAPVSNIKPGMGHPPDALAATKAPQNSQPQFVGPYYQTSSAHPPLARPQQQQFYQPREGYPQQGYQQPDEHFQHSYGLAPQNTLHQGLGNTSYMPQPPGYGETNAQRKRGVQRYADSGYKPEATTSAPPRRADNRQNGRRGGGDAGKKSSKNEGSGGAVAAGAKFESRSAAESQKRAELVESPTTRLKFKDFYRQFRAREKESFDEAYAYAQEGLETLPKKIHWRVYLEMADLAKRENKFSDARQLYKTVNKLQPYAPQGWLEYSKMEEECGRLYHCQKILHEGLKYCNFSESLLTKAIKHEERMGNLTAARGLLGRLRTQSVEKAWRTILEGALLEARAGNVVVARKVFKYLMQNVPWYGPIYFEAARFEEKNEEFHRAIKIVEKGLREIPRYGPLWFNAFRLHETTEMLTAKNDMLTNPNSRIKAVKVKLLREDVDNAFLRVFNIPIDMFQETPDSCNFTQTRGALQRAMNCISKELVWKVHFEAAQVAERGKLIGWLEKARHAYVQSVLRCPINLRWKIWLAGARTELTSGNIEKARQLLQQALKDVPDKSKAQVLLECSRLEEYTQNLDDARKTLARARDETKHEWKVFLESVMLEVRCGNREPALKEAEAALKIHSGTGRLWAILVQLKHSHGPDLQRIAFREALKMVPKSGEVWCEGARVHMHPLSPHFDLDTADRYLEFAIQFTPQYGDSFIEALRWELLKLDEDSNLSDQEYSDVLNNYDTSRIEQRCVNADPNYGGLWFHCKRGPFDTARQVLRMAKQILAVELVRFRSVYRIAYLASKAKQREKLKQKDQTRARTTPALADGENCWLTDRLTSAGWSSEAVEIADFSTGLASVNWIKERVSLLNDTERRKILFGSDTIVP